MSGIALKDLTKYHQRAMQYFKNGLVSEQNRLFAQTEEAGAVSFWPLGGTPLEGKVKFSFKETPPASGDKGPSNPSTITGVNSVKVTRCGKNVCSTKNLFPATPNLFALDTATGGIKVSGTTGGRGGAIEFRSVPNSLNALDGGMLQRGKTYTFSHTGNAPENNYPYFRVYIKDTATSGWGSARVVVPNGSSVTYAIPSTAYACLVRIDVGYNSTYNCECFVQIEEGTTATAFEPYSDTDYTLSLGNTYYGGEIDLATGVMTVTWGATTVTGTENWSRRSNSPSGLSVFQSGLGLAQGVMSGDPSNTTRFCTHFQYSTSWASDRFTSWGTATNVILTKSSEEYSDATAFKNWLASEYSNGHPVMIGYKLNTPFTVQLTPLQLTALTQKDKYTPRANTVYTDADSIQIRYRKSLIHDEDEKVQAITALGGNV